MTFPIPETTKDFLSNYPFLKPKQVLNEGLSAEDWKVEKGTVDQSSNKYVVIVFGKKSNLEGRLSPDGKLRIFAIVQHFLNDILSRQDSELTIVFSGYKSESIALEAFFRTTVAGFNLDVSKIKILREDEARTTEQNAINTAAILKEKNINPSHIFFCSTDWHVIRMWWNHALVKEKSEICKYLDQYENIIVEPLFAPYSYRAISQPDWMRWRAEFHVYTHFLAPFVSYLFAIADEYELSDDGLLNKDELLMDKNFNQEITTLLLEVFQELIRMTEEHSAISRENRGILDKWIYNLEHLDTFVSNADKWSRSGRPVSDINLLSYTNDSSWPDYAKFVNGVINDIRHPSDPDRT